MCNCRAIMYVNLIEEFRMQPELVPLFQFIDSF